MVRSGFILEDERVVASHEAEFIDNANHEPQALIGGLFQRRPWI